MVSLFSIPAADSMENPLLAFQMVSKTFISTDLPTVCFDISVYSGHRNSSVVQKRVYVLRIRFFFPSSPSTCLLEELVILPNTCPLEESWVVAVLKILQFWGREVSVPKPLSRWRWFVRPCAQSLRH